MELRVLRYFLAVAQEGNITKAAQQLHITQPTLSRQLAQLEDELGVALFKRGARRLELTAAGLQLRRRAEELSELAHKTVQEVVASESSVAGTVTISLGEVAAASLVAQAISSFKKLYPAVVFDIVTATADVVKEQLEKGLADLGLMLEPAEVERFAFLRLQQRERWVVLMQPGAPLAQREAVSPEDLAKLPVIMPRRVDMQHKLAAWFGPFYKDLDIAFTSNFPTNATALVRQGLGYALVIEGLQGRWDGAYVCSRPLLPPLEASIVLTWKKNQPLSPAVSRFIQHLQATLG